MHFTSSINYNDKCGLTAYPIRKTDPSGNKIAGGWYATPHSLPYQSGNGTDAVLTSARCLYQESLRKPVPVDKVDVISGAHDLENNFEESQRKIPVKNFEKILYTDKTRPACLPDKDESRMRASCVMHLDGDPLSLEPRIAHFGGHGICDGDSGGPLTCERNGKLVVFGISSGHTGLCGQYGKPGIFTKVSSFLDWIKKTDTELDTAVDMSKGKKAENIAQPLDSDETTDAKQAGKVKEQFPCGLSAFPMKKEQSPSNRVSGGWETRPNSLPYQVKLINQKQGKEFACGGTLIQFKPGNGTFWILTAAHCIYDNLRKKTLDPEKVQVLVGAHNVYRDSEENRKQIAVQNVIMQPGYNDRTIANDIALLQLQEPVFYTTVTRPACLPNPGEKPLPTTSCWVSGWGAESSYGEPTAILKVAKVAIWNDADCKVDATSSICLGGKADRRGSCQGDSGGPLLCEHNKRMVVFGVSSSVVGHCGQLNQPSIYTRVTHYLDWLKETSEKAGDLKVTAASSTGGSSATSKPNKAKDDFTVRPSSPAKSVSSVPSQPAFPGSRFMTPLPTPGRPAASRFYTPPSSGLSRSRFQTL
ncbi:Transmembrane protease serine [Trichinella spiralis]|uniref:Transmembrane protease serine n=1 Tax=Trichinella spiralis TaxID=6334 RepID=A0ABR3KBA1_TRISP